MNNKYIILTISFSILFLTANVVGAENSSVNIKNEVYSSANSGGNTGENVKTGDATVTSRIINNISENVQQKVENKVKAEVKGEGSASVSVNGEEKSCETEGDGTCSVEINTNENGNDVSEGEVMGGAGSNDEESGTVEGVTDEKKGILAGIGQVVGNILETAFGGIMSVFK